MSEARPAARDLDHYRKAAKRLVRAHAAGDPEALARAERALGERAARRFALSDAQWVIAREHGHRSWAAFRTAVELGPVAAQLEAARAVWDGTRESVVESALTYDGLEPVAIRVRKRGRRYDLDDGGAAVRKAGRAPGWLELAERTVAEDGMNISRQGVVFVPAFEGGLDLAWLAERLAGSSLAVYRALLELDDR
jgi:hypothetical protein